MKRTACCRNLTMLMLVLVWTARAEAQGRLDPGPRSGDSPAALAFTKHPLLEWWQGLSKTERGEMLIKYPVLAKSIDYHRALLRATVSEGGITGRALRDWWDANNQLQRNSILKAQPKLNDAFSQWRKSIDDWTTKERNPSAAKH